MRSHAACYDPIIRNGKEVLVGYGGRSGRSLSLWCAWVIVCLLAVLCHAQAEASKVPGNSTAVYEFDRDRLPIASLDGLWRFTAGDDPDGTKGWASPAFDDNSWQLVQSGASWTEQPEAAFAGPAWFRAKVVLPPRAQGLAVYLPQTFLNYQLYADGQLLGGQGPMPPSPRASITHPVLLPLPTASSGHTIVFALRVWRWPQWNYFYKFGLPVGIQIGTGHTARSETGEYA